MNARATQSLHLPLVPLGLSISTFFAISFLGCILLGIVVPDGAMHKRWLQFFPLLRMVDRAQHRDRTRLDPGLWLVDGAGVWFPVQLLCRSQRISTQ